MMRYDSRVIARRWLAVALAAALVLPWRASAQGGSALVAVVTAEPASAMARAVRRELELLGLDVIVLRPSAEATVARSPLEQAARSVGAIAAVRLVPSAGGAEVWVADRVTGKTLVRRLLSPDGRESEIALGAVELLRASLMELHAPSPPVGELPATSQVGALALPTVAPSTSEPPHLGLSVAAAIEPVRGLAPLGAAQLAVWARIAGGLGVRAFANLTFAAAEAHVPEGAVRVTAHLLGAEASYDLRASELRWVPVVGVGAAAAWVQAAGAANAPFQGASSTAWRGGPYARMGLGCAVARGLRLRADALALVVPTRTSIGVAGRTIGQWGRPELVFSLGFETLLAF